LLSSVFDELQRNSSLNLWKKEFLLTTTEESKKIMAMDGV